jgi:hypothetical protein
LLSQAISRLSLVAATKRYKALRELSAAQITAIDALMAGDTHEQAAKKAGVHRVTVSRWTEDHPAVRAELNRRRRELNEQRAARLRELDEVALQAVSSHLDTLDPQFALKWLRLRGLDISENGSTDPEEIIAQAARARMQVPQDGLNGLRTRAIELGWITEDSMREKVEEELARRYDLVD